MSNLLRRSSQDEPGADDPLAAAQPAAAAAPPAATAQAPAVEPVPAPSPAMNGNGKMNSALGSISNDIAKAIDQRVAMEVWERYRRGERNAFTRRLYTLQGQQTFDEIRKRYQKSQDFKDAVDRYVADFERLLDEITRNGEDRNAGNEYLVTDTGKIYTMLAHASGRFDA